VLLVAVVVLVVPPLIGPLLGPLLLVPFRLVEVRLALLAAASHRVLVIATRPPQTMHVRLQTQIELPRHLRSLRKLTYYRNEAVRVQCCIVLLTKSHGSLFPVGHLFSLADLEVQNFLGHFGESGLLRCYEHFAVVGLGVDEVPHVFVEVHAGQMLCEHVHVTFE
jgi:hypothetical protein